MEPFRPLPQGHLTLFQKLTWYLMLWYRDLSDNDKVWHKEQAKKGAKRIKARLAAVAKAAVFFLKHKARTQDAKAAASKAKRAKGNSGGDPEHCQ